MKMQVTCHANMGSICCSDAMSLHQHAPALVQMPGACVPVQMQSLADLQWQSVQTFSAHVHSLDVRLACCSDAVSLHQHAPALVQRPGAWVPVQMQSLADLQWQSVQTLSAHVHSFEVRLACCSDAVSLHQHAPALVQRPGAWV